MSYADALAEARALVNHARLDDPGEHFPYKHEAVSALIAENPPAGPQGPDDDRVVVRDMISQPIADASRNYIEAQAAYLASPGDGTEIAYKAAAEDLVAARQAHRANRPADGMAVIGFRGAE